MQEGDEPIMSPDPLDGLRQANPWPHDAVSALATPRLPDELDELLHSDAAPRRPARISPLARRRVVTVAAVAAVAGLLAACGVVYALLARQPDQPSVVACYGAAEVGGDIVVRPTDGADPIDACTRVWQTGGFGPDRTEAPPLTACVMESGVPGVFPSGDPKTCERLGLDAATFAPSDTPQLRRALIDTVFAASPCVAIDEARAGVARVLDARGATGWRVEEGTFSSAQPCATLAFDEAAKVITLVPIARR